MGMTHQVRPSNSCSQCGATSYRPVIGRDGRGAMQPTGRYCCTGCNLEFGVLDEWRHARSDKAGHAMHESLLS